MIDKLVIAKKVDILIKEMEEIEYEHKNDEHPIVMFVDDEIMVLSALKRGLRNLPFNKIYVSDPRLVMDIFRKKEISVIVTDMKMPNINGLELLKIIKEEYPDTIKIVLSGYTQLPQVLASLNYGEIYKFITKPWNLEEEFIPIINEALEKYDRTSKMRIVNNTALQKSKTYKKMLDISQTKENNFQNEVIKIRDLSSFIFYSLENDLKNTEYENDIAIYADIYNAFMYSFPTVNLVFSLKKFEIDINESLDQQRGSFSVDGISEAEKSKNFKGNYKLLLNICIVINKYVIKTCGIQDTSLTAKLVDTNGTYTLVFMKKIDFKNKEMKSIMKKLGSVINNIVITLGGSYEVMNVENQYYYRLTTKFRD